MMMNFKHNDSKYNNKSYNALMNMMNSLNFPMPLIFS